MLLTAQDEEYLDSDPTKVRKKEVVRTDPRYFLPSADHIRSVNRRLHKETKMRGFLKVKATMEH